jgi:hypothetical protein
MADSVKQGRAPVQRLGVRRHILDAERANERESLRHGASVKHTPKKQQQRKKACQKEKISHSVESQTLPSRCACGRKWLATTVTSTSLLCRGREERAKELCSEGDVSIHMYVRTPLAFPIYTATTTTPPPSPHPYSALARHDGTQCVGDRGSFRHRQGIGAAACGPRLHMPHSE